MSMTKKTYETVAKVLYQEWSSTSGMDVDEASSVQASVSAMTDDFVEAFKADNPLFREDWFRAACKGDWANVGGGR